MTAAVGCQSPRNELLPGTWYCEETTRSVRRVDISTSRRNGTAHEVASIASSVQGQFTSSTGPIQNTAVKRSMPVAKRHDAYQCRNLVSSG